MTAETALKRRFFLIRKARGFIPHWNAILKKLIRKARGIGEKLIRKARGID